MPDFFDEVLGPDPEPPPRFPLPSFADAPKGDFFDAVLGPGDLAAPSEPRPLPDFLLPKAEFENKYLRQMLTETGSQDVLLKGRIDSPTGTALAHYAPQVGTDLASMVARFTGDNDTADVLNRQSTILEERASRFDKDALPGTRLGRSIARSLTKIIPASAAGGFPAAVATGAVDYGNQSYTRALDMGMSEEDAALYGTASGVVNGALTAVMGATGAEAPLGELLNKSLWVGAKEIAKQGTMEGVEEVLQGGGQTIIDAIAGLPTEELAALKNGDLGVIDRVAPMLKNRVDDFIGGFVGAAAVHVATPAIGKVTGAFAGKFLPTETEIDQTVETKRIYDDAKAQQAYDQFKQPPAPPPVDDNAVRIAAEQDAAAAEGVTTTPLSKRANEILARVATDPELAAQVAEAGTGRQAWNKLGLRNTSLPDRIAVSQRLQADKSAITSQQVAADVSPAIVEKTPQDLQQEKPALPSEPATQAPLPSPEPISSQLPAAQSAESGVQPPAAVEPPKVRGKQPAQPSAAEVELGTPELQDKLFAFAESFLARKGLKKRGDPGELVQNANMNLLAKIRNGEFNPAEGNLEGYIKENMRQVFQHTKEKIATRGRIMQDVEKSGLTYTGSRASDPAKLAEAREDMRALGVDEDTLNEVSYEISKKAPHAKISRAHIMSAFPGAKITDRIAGDGWSVSLPNSFTFDVQVTDKISVNWDAAERQSGRKFSPEQRARLAASGSFEITGKDGTRVSGLGLLQLSRSLADSDTVRHEALHVARKLGLFKPDEWNALVKRHSSPNKSDTQQEEDIAKARGAWRAAAPLMVKVRGFFRRMLDSLGITRGLSADDVHALMDTSQFWGRSITAKAGTKIVSIGIGRPELANIGTSKGARQAVDVVDQMRKDMGIPQRRPDTDVREEAAALRAKHGLDGVVSTVMARGNGGGELTDVETVAAKAAFNELYETAAKSGDPAKMLRAMEFMNAYRNTGTAQARAFRQRVDPQETPAQRRKRVLAEGIMSPPTKMQRKMDKARAGGDKAELDRLMRQWADDYAKLAYELKQVDIDVADLDAIAADPIATAKTAAAVSARKATYFDKAFEYWRNWGLLSGPQTHIANLTGNVLFQPLRRAERRVEAMLNLLTNDPRAAQMGEWKYQVAGTGPTMQQALRNAIAAFDSERSMLSDAAAAGSKVEESTAAVGGKLGRVVRIPQRLLQAADDFAKTIVINQEAGAMAFHIAKAEGLSGDAIAARVNELVSDPNSFAWEAAYAEALKATFQEPPGALGQAVLKLRRTLPGARYVFPFVTTPAAIFREGAIARTPVGLLKWAWQRGTKGAEVSGPLAPVLAKQAMFGLASAIMWAFWDTDDDEWPVQITGAQHGPNTEQGRMTQSIRIGKTWYRYGRIEPFATALAILADTRDGLKAGGAVSAVESGLTSIKDQLEDKTFLSGIADIMRMYQGAKNDSAKPLLDWATKFAASWVPNLYRQVAREVQSTSGETRSWGKGAELATRAGKRALQQAQVLPSLPAVDLWGRDRKTGQSMLGPMTDIPWRILSPVKVAKDDVFIGDRMIFAWNRLHADKEMRFGTPEPYFRVEKKAHWLTDEQYQKYAKLAGQTAREYVENEAFESPDNPTEEDMNRLRALLTAARKEARGALWDEVVK